MLDALVADHPAALPLLVVQAMMPPMRSVPTSLSTVAEQQVMHRSQTCLSASSCS